MTDTPYLTRAREWLRHEFGSGTHEDRAESLAVEIASIAMQVRNEALEEAARAVEASLFSYPKPRADLAARIRSLSWEQDQCQQ